MELGHDLRQDVGASGVGPRPHDDSDAASDQDAVAYGRDQDVRRVRVVQHSPVACDGAEHGGPYREHRRSDEDLQAVLRAEEVHPQEEQRYVDAQHRHAGIDAQGVVEYRADACDSASGEPGGVREDGDAACGHERAEEDACVVLDQTLWVDGSHVFRFLHDCTGTATSWQGLLRIYAHIIQKAHAVAFRHAITI